MTIELALDDVEALFYKAIRCTFSSTGTYLYTTYTYIDGCTIKVCG